MKFFALISLCYAAVDQDKVCHCARTTLKVSFNSHLANTIGSCLLDQGLNVVQFINYVKSVTGTSASAAQCCKANYRLRDYRDLISNLCVRSKQNDVKCYAAAMCVVNTQDFWCPSSNWGTVGNTPACKIFSKSY